MRARWAVWIWADDRVWLFAAACVINFRFQCWFGRDLWLHTAYITDRMPSWRFLRMFLFFWAHACNTNFQKFSEWSGINRLAIASCAARRIEINCEFVRVARSWCGSTDQLQHTQIYRHTPVRHEEMFWLPIYLYEWEILVYKYIQIPGIRNNESEIVSELYLISISIMNFFFFGIECWLGTVGEWSK